MIANPSFDLLGAQPGLAADWTLTTSVISRGVAVFEDPRTPGYLLGIERFEWFDAVPELLSEAAEFGLLNEAVEVFDWSPLLATWGEIESGPADFSGVPVDAFDWSPYTPTWGQVSKAAATFSALPQETFEGWSTLLATWSSIASSPADFTGSSAETFSDPAWDNLDP